MRTRNLGLLVLLGAVALMLQACPSAGVYRTAKTLEPGTSDIGLSFNATKLSSESIEATSDGQTQTEDTSSGPDIVIPKILPEVSFHIGVADNVEVGGRVDITAGLLELDTKYRFLKSSGLHVAVQPAAAYQSFFFIEGYRLTLPLMVTYEINDWFAVNAYGLGQYSSLSPTDDTADGAVDISGASVGGGGGLTFSGETFYFSPSIEYTQTLLEAEDDDANSVGFNYTYTVVSLNMGWILGKEKKQLDRIENKIDKMDDKLDKALEK